MKDPTTPLLIPEFGSTSVDERFKITVGNATTIPQITLSLQLIEKSQKMELKRAKYGVKKGGEMMTKGALRGSGGAKKG